MAENLREPFVNPYVEESANEARFGTVVTMDEAHERWFKGTWRADKANFTLDESFLSDNRNGPESEMPEKNRFAFDLKRDIIDSDMASSRLEDISYSAGYRPQGSIGSNISNLTVNRLRYNALADIKEELPDDLSYLYGSNSGRRVRKDKESDRARSRDRLETSVDKRRAALDKMLPERRGETPQMIMEDIKRRREIEDAKSGIVRTAHPRRYRRGIYDVSPEPGSILEFYDAAEEYGQENITERGSFRSDIPVQDGLVPDTKTQPYFGRFSRTWSEISPINPTRSEMLRHTVNTIYDDEPQHNGRSGRFRANSEGRNEYYVSDVDFDPEDRYRRLSRQRKQVRAGDNVLHDRIMSGKFNNPYIDVSNEKLQKVINHDLRGPGNSPEPEGLTDPALRYEWDMGYSRVNTDENKYAQWMAEQSRLAENAEQSRYRGSHRTGRPGAYMQREKSYGEERRYPRGRYREREIRRRDMVEQMQRATEKGIAEGREIIRRQQMEQQKRAQQYYAQQQEYYKRRQEYYKQQQEQMMKRQQAYICKQAQAGGNRRNSAAAPNSGKGPVGQSEGNAAAPKQTAQNPNRMPQYGPWGYYSYNQYYGQGATPRTSQGEGRPTDVGGSPKKG